MPEPTATAPRKPIPRDRLDELLDDAHKATAGRWGAFGMSLLSGDSGMNADTADHVADFYTRDDQGKPRTFDLDHVVNFQPRTAVTLVEEVIALRKAKRDLAQALIHTREYVEPTVTLPAVEGWSWYDAIREHAPDMMPGAQPLRGGLPDEDPAREAQWQADRGRTPVVYHDASGNPLLAEPVLKPGWRETLRADLEARFTEYGWHGLAKAMRRERGESR